MIFALCLGNKIVVPQMTVAEAMVELCEKKRNHTAYEVIAVAQDEILGTVDLQDGNLVVTYYEDNSKEVVK